MFVRLFRQFVVEFSGRHHEEVLDLSWLHDWLSIVLVLFINNKISFSFQWHTVPRLILNCLHLGVLQLIYTSRRLPCIYIL